MGKSITFNNEQAVAFGALSGGAGYYIAKYFNNPHIDPMMYGIMMSSSSLSMIASNEKFGFTGLFVASAIGLYSLYYTFKGPVLFDDVMKYTVLLAPLIYFPAVEIVDSVLGDKNSK
jgi:hypothetical protein